MGEDFRRLDVADARTLFSLLTPLYKNPAYPMGGSWTLHLLEKEIEQGDSIGLFNQEGLLAFILYRAQGDVWDVVLLATHVQHQRKGYMVRLLKEWIGQKPSMTQIWLEVHEANAAAQNLYKKLGFRKVGHRRQYYRDGSGAVLYALR